MPHFILHQEMAMRKVTRTLFVEDEDDDMVSTSSRSRSLPRQRSVTHPVVCVIVCVAPCRELTARAAQTTSTTCGAAR